MSNRDPLAAEVLVTTEISAEEKHAIVDAFCALDVAVRIRMIPTRRGLEQLHWLVLATLPLHAFLSGLGAACSGRRPGAETAGWPSGRC
jgi:hypothetical protein